MEPPVVNPQYFDRDISWLKFNGLVLEQAANPAVPVLDQIKFLSIFSSNLDEFYRVRMPVLLAFDKLAGKGAANISITANAADATALIEQQQQTFGKILKEDIIPSLAKNNIVLWYNQPLDAGIFDQSSDWFYSQVMAFLQPVYLSKKGFYPKNNLLYFLVVLKTHQGDEEVVILNIPSDKLSRFFTISASGKTHVVFIDDVIKYHLPQLFTNATVKGCYAFKITRDADLDLKDEYDGDMAEQIEQQIVKREFGLATRFLYQPGIPLRIFETITQKFKLGNSKFVEGGGYHNLKDLVSFPVKNKELSYEDWAAVKAENIGNTGSIFDSIAQKDIIVHTPYNDYGTILRFFNEAAADAEVEEIYVSLYRVASDSRIVNALISAVKNGKKVHVLLELKARFDEANNLKWAKKLQKAGASIIYSVTALKVHAKIALVKRRQGNRLKYFGLLGTGNFNEGTARFYTDHILMTANSALLREVELLFMFLAKRVKPEKHAPIKFNYLLVSKYNLQQRFLDLIEREIEYVRNGKPGAITIKLNNLQERVLINKLYEASNAGVKINLIVRSICCIVPGVKQMSENITVTRIVDRYLEHGRVFIFNNNGEPDVYLGSADWMNRNIYHRIEVCYPVYDADIKNQLLAMIQLQLADNTQAVHIDADLNNQPVKGGQKAVQAQPELYKLVKKQAEQTIPK